MCRTLKISLVLCIFFISCKKEAYRYSVDARFNPVIIEANKVIYDHGLKLELVPSTTSSDVEVSNALCDGHTGEQRRCRLKVCDTSRPPKLMARTLLHEIGHCAGLEHTTDRANIMFPMNTDGVGFTKEQANKINEGT